MKPVATFGWPAAACVELGVLWNTTDLSAIEVAERMTAMMGRPISKNAVLGQVRRLREKGMPMKVKGPTMAERQARAAEIEAARVIQARAKLAAMEGRFDGWPEKGECVWPIGDPGTPGFRFCCAPRGADHRYCPAHCAVAFREKPEKSEQPMVIGKGSR